jgi:hypothetical protein
MKTQEMAHQMNLISEKQAEAFRDKLEQTLIASSMSSTSEILKHWAPQNARCPKCSDWKVGQGSYFSGKQKHTRENCTYCNGTGIMPIPLSEFDVLS